MRPRLVALRLDRAEAADDAEQHRERLAVLEPLVAAEEEHPAESEDRVDHGDQGDDLRPARHAARQLEAREGEVERRGGPDADVGQLPHAAEPAGRAAIAS